MKIHSLRGMPDVALSQALERFESGFTYPLGENTRFSISHGEDYPRFYRAMGPCNVVVAERDGEVLGTLGGAIRQIRAADGTSSAVLYVGDLKVLPGVGAGLTLIRLAAALYAWARPQVTTAYGVVMDGTPKTPDRYTGRLGVPAFGEIGKVMVMRLGCEGAVAAQTEEFMCENRVGLETFSTLARAAYAATDGNSPERSMIQPQWLRLESGAACGMLEDTRKAKRLFEVGGEELRSAHLSYFAFRDPTSGARLIKAAASVAAGVGFPALFFSVPANWAGDLVDAIGLPAPKLAPATVYGVGFPGALPWLINTAEI